MNWKKFAYDNDYAIHRHLQNWTDAIGSQVAGISKISLKAGSWHWLWWNWSLTYLLEMDEVKDEDYTGALRSFMIRLTLPASMMFAIRMVIDQDRPPILNRRCFMATVFRSILILAYQSERIALLLRNWSWTSYAARLLCWDVLLITITLYPATSTRPLRLPPIFEAFFDFTALAWQMDDQSQTAKPATCLGDHLWDRWPGCMWPNTRVGRNWPTWFRDRCNCRSSWTHRYRIRLSYLLLSGSDGHFSPDA